MDYYCNVCDKSIKAKSQSEHPQSITNKNFEYCIQLEHAIEINPDFFDIDEIFNDFITNKKLDFHVVKNVFN